MNGNRIKEVRTKQILDSRGRPVVETEIYTENSRTGRAGASTGTSVGKNESYILRNNDRESFGDPSVFKAVKNTEKIIGPALVGIDVADQQAVDHRMVELDGTRYKTNLGGNAIYSVSCAAIGVAAASVRKSLWRYLAEEEPERVLAPTYNMINGGTYGNYTLVFQEFIVTPKSANAFYEGSRIEAEIFQRMRGVIKKYNNGEPPVMGNYSGYGAPSDNPFILFDMLTEATSSLGCEDKIISFMDYAASEICDEARGAYLYRGTYIDRDEVISLLSRIMHKYPVGLIEGALWERGLEGFKKARKGVRAVSVGDDFIYSSIDRTKKAIGMGAIQGMILKPNQIGTLTEATETARFMKQHGLLVVASGRTGGVIDDPDTELAVTLGLPVMKTGAPGSRERTVFINTGLRVEEQLEPGKTMVDVLEVPGFERLG